MRRLDIVVALVLLLVSALMIAGTRELAFWSDFSPGDRFMPVIVATVLALLSLAALASAWRGEGDGDPVAWPEGRAARRVATFAAAIVAFALGAASLGFLLAIFGFMLFSLLVILRKPVVPSLFASVLSTGIVQGIFVTWLGLRLPTGPLGF